MKTNSAPLRDWNLAFNMSKDEILIYIVKEITWFSLMSVYCWELAGKTVKQHHLLTFAISSPHIDNHKCMKRSFITAVHENIKRQGAIKKIYDAATNNNAVKAEMNQTFESHHGIWRISLCLMFFENTMPDIITPQSVQLLASGAVWRSHVALNWKLGCSSQMQGFSV